MTFTFPAPGFEKPTIQAALEDALLAAMARVRGASAADRKSRLQRAREITAAIRAVRHGRYHCD